MVGVGWGVGVKYYRGNVCFFPQIPTLKSNTQCAGVLVFGGRPFGR